MTPTISIVGRSGSGKTTLLEKIVAELTSRGYTIGTIKHDVHGFEIDYEGKDSWRHKRAGAKIVVLSGPGKLAVIKDVDEEWPPSRLGFSFLDEVDLIITEGYKKAGYPKIEVVRKATSTKLMCGKDKHLLAIASDIKFKRRDVPCVDINDAKGIANLIEKRFLQKQPVSGRSGKADLIVNGKQITLKPFINGMLAEAIKGMLKSLKGCGSPKDIEIRIRG
ncbi:MAG: molybdopterin-guanine dinucleotide biosynthesis protein B [Deltaproteobacteria bacterium]|nr:molybdopterin-guanine dinucleotide biosynthesis protein B [Deltaproteobacteria bacterium]